MTSPAYHSWTAKPNEVERRWWLVDGKNQVLGRVASRIARVLQGKAKPTWTPHIDTGDFVVVVNAEHVVLTRTKGDQKLYRQHSGWPGGMTVVSYNQMRATHPDRVVRLAVKRMLPKSKLGRQMIGKLKIYAGPKHPHEAQRPAPLAF